MTPLEADVPRGGFAEYGLLGMQFEAATEGTLRIEVPYSEGGDRWSEALGAAVDEVRFGLPREYTRAIRDVASTNAARRFPPGVIRIVEAAHGLVESNSRLFGRLAACVLELMLDATRGDDDTANLLRKCLVETSR